MKKLSVIVMTVMTFAVWVAATALSADKLVVKDSTGTNTLFAVEDGSSTPNRMLRVLGGVPLMQNAGLAGFDFKNTGATFGASITVGIAGNPNMYANWNGTTNGKDDPAKPTWGLRLDITHDNFHVLRSPAGGGLSDVLVINADGSITSSTGATLSAGGQWLPASSREYKENITALSVEEAIDTLAGLNPVRYNYKADRDEKHVGFIAEDVPELVATKDRKTLSPLDIVAVLTKVVKEQKEILDTKSRIVESQQKILEEQQKTIAKISEKLEKLERVLQWKGSLVSSVD